MLFGLKRTPGKLLIDAPLFALSWVLAFWLRFGESVPAEYQSMLWSYLPVAIAVKLLVFSFLGTYKSVWRYSSLSDLVNLTRAVAVSWVLLAILVFVVRADSSFSRGVALIDAALTFLFTGAVRLLPRVLRETVDPTILARIPRSLQKWVIGNKYITGKPTLIIGAGDAGETVIRFLMREEITGYRPVALVDDDPKKQGHRIHGISVAGTTEDIPALLEDLRCRVALIAIPSASPETLRQIAKLCRKVPVEVRILPDLKSLISGHRTFSDIQELDIESILGREAIDLSIEGSGSYVTGRRVLITGAGGSIGSELCRQIIRLRPSEMVLFGRGENSIFKIYNELYRMGTAVEFHQIIGDVINKRKLEGVFDRHSPEIIFHAGADKHVPLMEMNPDEAVLNNIVGTRNVLELADSRGTERVVSISTDKAVNPTSVMGCCKRVAEMFIQSGDYRNTKAVGVRFGNVLGSRGSVIPVLEEQIAGGGPVTVTDENVVRYFMTIPEAVQLVIQAGALAEGGEIFILEMGDPVRILDLARNLIRLHGYEPEDEIPIRMIGLRPGEKLEEELVIPGEKVSLTTHPKILRVDPNPAARRNANLTAAVAELTELAVQMNDAGIRDALLRLVPEYVPYPAPKVKSMKVKRS